MADSFEHRGFRHLGRDKVRNKVREMFRRVGYIFQPRDLLRHKCREGTGLCFETVATISSDDRSQGIDTLATSLLHHRLGIQQLGMTNVVCDVVTLESIVREAADADVSDSRFVHLCNSAISCATTPQDLIRLFNGSLLPAFFQRFPHGSIQCLRSNNAAESLRALMEIQYAVQFQNICQLGDLSSSMRNWHVGDPAELFRSILGLSGFLWPPFVTSYVAGALQSPIIVRMDPPSQQKPLPFGLTWNDFLRHGSAFGGEELSVFDAIKNPKGSTHRQMSHRKLLSDKVPPITERLLLQDWLLKTAQRFVLNVVDICNFTTDYADSGNIDPVFAMEHLWTVERIIKLTLRVSATSDPSIARSTTFEIADLYETLACRFGMVKNETEFFKSLFNPATGKASVVGRLLKIEGVGQELAEQSQRVYDLLRSTTLNSVCKKSKVDLKRQVIRVKDKTLNRENEEPIDVFVGNLMRALRNGHHGYFTASDSKAKRPSRYLWLVDGNTPDAIANLPILWFFAYLADPSFVGWRPIGFGLDPL